MLKKKNSFLEKYFKDYAESDFYLNEIDYNLFDVEKFNERFKIIKITYDKLDDEGNPKYLSFKSRLFADLLEKEKILSVSYIGGSSVFILLSRKSDFDWYDLADYLEERDPNFEREYYSYEFVEIKPMDVYHKMQLLNERRVAANKKSFCYYDDIENRRLMDTVYRLLLNALARKKGSEFDDGVSNVDGQLYLYVDRDSNKAQRHIRTLNVSANNGLLDFKIVTFKRYKPSKSRESEDNTNNVDKYILQYGTNDSIKLERYFGAFDKSKEIFIQGSDVRRTVNFDNLNFHKRATKVRVLHNLIDDFNYEYGEFAKLGFVKRNLKCIKMIDNANIKEFANLDYQTLTSLNVVAMEDVDVDDKVAEKFLNHLRNPDLKLDVSNITREFDRDKPNIVIINDTEYYDKNKKEDVKNKIPKDILHQCITLKNINKDSPAISRKLLSELYIKKEIFNRHINNWCFGKCEFYLGMRVKIADKTYENLHCLMKINAAGDFELIDDESLIDKFYIFELDKFEKTGNVCIVKKDNKINEIEEMEYRLMPDKDSVKSLIKKSIKKGNESTRMKTGKYLSNPIYYPYLNKLVFELNDEIFYSIGIAEKDLNRNVQNLNRIYRISPLKNSEYDEFDYIPEIIDMLKTYHVSSSKSESVRPYPFKYILEYLRMKHPDIKEKIRF